jgi:hypothetical protein
LARRFEAMEGEVGIPIHYSWPPAFWRLGRLMRQDAMSCGVHNILGILADGTLAMCGIGRHEKELVYGRIGETPAWVQPSPNMPSRDTALVYPGMCLLEGTNLSEARGTTRPFEIVGAPWLDADDTATWLAVLNDARLAFGTRLGIADDTDIFRIVPGDPLAPEKAAYAWLTALQGALVETMLTGLGD